MSKLRKRFPVLYHKKLQRYLSQFVDTPLQADGDGWCNSAYCVVIKPIRVYKKLAGNKIANLIIPEGAVIYVDCRVFNMDKFYCEARKFRASEAFVHSVVDVKTHKQRKSGSSRWDHSFKYVVGKKVIPHRFECDGFAQCAGGIHFFVNVQDALDWNG